MNNGAATMGNEFMDPAIFCGSTVSGGTLNWGKTVYVANSSTNATYVQGTPGLALINQVNAFSEYSLYGSYTGTLSGRNGAGFSIGTTTLASSNSGDNNAVIIVALGTGTVNFTGNVFNNNYTGSSITAAPRPRSLPAPSARISSTMPHTAVNSTISSDSHLRV